MADKTDICPECFDAGLLNDFGGGDIRWWQDYIRSLLGQAHDFYSSQLSAANGRIAELEAVVEKLPKTADGVPMAIGQHIWFRSLRSPRPLPPAEYCVTGWSWSSGMNEYCIDVFDEQGLGDTLKQDCCFSTREAAEAAKEKGNE